jgi:hypothetical protein
MRKKGYTYTEMLISLAISSFVVLSIGAASNIGRRSYGKVVEETKVYTDISYGFKLMQNRIRQAKNLSTQAASGVWVSNKLIVNDGAFGLYRAAGSLTIDFVYLADKDNENVREVIFSVAASASVNFTVNISGKAVTIRLYGEKKNIPFDVSTTVVRRS